MISQQQITGKISSLPSLPTSVARIASLLNDDRTGAKEFEQLIKPDLALTANLLKLANSAFFGLRREVTSVRQAIALMGIKRLFEVAAGAGFLRVIPPKLPGYEIESKGFWQHCLAVAVLSERLAEEVKCDTPDLIFTAGLLHDIGKLAIGSFLMDESVTLKSKLQAEHLSLVEVEKQILGNDHGDVGLTLANNWELPEAVCLTAKWHHWPNDIPEKKFQTLIDLVHVADCLAHTMGFGTDVGELSRKLESGAFERLCLPVRSLEVVASVSLEQIGEMSQLLTSKTGVSQ